MGIYCLVNTEFPFGTPYENVLELNSVMVAQHCECIKCYRWLILCFMYFSTMENQAKPILLPK